ncbi:hypothetical protein BOX15_Mlig001089g1, partial [Macrostomum lignano]
SAAALTTRPSSPTYKHSYKLSQFMGRKQRLPRRQEDDVAIAGSVFTDSPDNAVEVATSLRRPLSVTQAAAELDGGATVPIVFSPSPTPPLSPSLVSAASSLLSSPPIPLLTASTSSAASPPPPPPRKQLRLVARASTEQPQQQRLPRRQNRKRSLAAEPLSAARFASTASIYILPAQRRLQSLQPPAPPSPPMSLFGSGESTNSCSNLSLPASAATSDDCGWLACNREDSPEAASVSLAESDPLISCRWLKAGAPQPVCGSGGGSLTSHVTTRPSEPQLPAVGPLLELEELFPLEQIWSQQGDWLLPSDPGSAGSVFAVFNSVFVWSSDAFRLCQPDWLILSR